ncbi:MAG: NapC/NirT family cytochrome c [Desulfobulbaceae bacterium]|uniref:NapC/NirT family cytochrome c n=1 Tax=Candidatus Desulfatifera sulfidica TaxID=2841691 RepID=A0A8J6TAF1_9BACT|nr:NapC/NirT family cytochrome c [Candidatus Desulfatifera sulfidica]
MTTPDTTPDLKNQQPPEENGAWRTLLSCTWKTPLGLMGISITTISITLLIIGTFAHMVGLIHNHYAAIFTFMVLPAGMLIGLLIIPLACFMRRKGWFGKTLTAEQLTINLSDSKHRKTIILFLVLTVINITLLGVVSYEGYHFTDSPYFCGVVCHEVMDPEYTAYQRSPHAKVSCVECHIGPGANWYVQAKLSGLRQVKAVFDGDFSRPIPAPVEHLRPARDTCEQCHWPEKFHGKKVKSYVSFSNRNQTEPYVQDIALHIGGRNPVTDSFEGIHWHVSNDIKVEYQPLDKKRTQIGKIKVTKSSGVTEEYTIDGAEESTQEWRTMDCIDCHNRPTHVYDDLEERVDFGLLSKKINPEIDGIREDSITVLKKEYTTRNDASEQIVETLLALQAKRHGNDFVAENEESLIASGSFLLETYLNNVWPAMSVTWGTYREHLGHRYADEGFGCFRCHDEEHSTEFGKVISQDCAMCHDEPE